MTQLGSYKSFSKQDRLDELTELLKSGDNPGFVRFATGLWTPQSC